MLYARVALGLPVSGPFDYIVAKELISKIKVGARAWVDFHQRRMLGYVVEITKKTKVKKLKTITSLIDDSPILERNILLLAKRLSEYYCCSWGEAIETTLPEALRKGRKIPDGNLCPAASFNLRSSAYNQRGVTLVHDLEGHARWQIYLKQIKEVTANNESVIVILPDIQSVETAKGSLSKELNCPIGTLYRKQKSELEEWAKIRSSRTSIVIGTRSAVFAPVKNLGLIILDAEENSVYKQEQVPHYHTREVAFMRISLQKAKLILGSPAPSLESFYLARKKKINYTLIPRKSTFPQIQIVSTQQKGILEKFLQDAILSTLNLGGRVLLFLNRKGFATYAFCHNCKKALQCPRCSINLVYDFQANSLSCHHCAFKMPLPKICPSCNSGYVKFLGTGTQRLESELSRLFPQARLSRLESKKNIDIKELDICVATSLITRYTDYKFDLIGILAVDNSLSRLDFRSSEKTFALLSALSGLSEKKIIIQTVFSRHHAFEALLKQDPDIFYTEELRQRQVLGFPPYRHLISIRLRGRKQEKIKAGAEDLFNRLKEGNKDKGVHLISVNPGQPAKLRDNFYWQVLLSCMHTKKTGAFLKMHLKNFPHSGIIVTVDVDPL